MAKAVIFNEVAGVKIEQLVAAHVKVQNRLDAEAFKGYIRAKGKLSTIKARSVVDSYNEGTGAVEGKSFIEPVAKGAIDRYLILSDERGDGAALAIEVGRDAYIARPGQQRFSVEGRDPEGNVARIVPRTEGAYVLHSAFGLSPGQLTGGGDAISSNGLVNEVRFPKEVIE